MMIKNDDRIEFWLAALGAVAAAWAAYTKLDSVLSAGADEALRGATAGAALASLIALASVLVGIHRPAGGFVLRFASAFMVMVFVWFASGLGKVLATAATLALILSTCLLFMRHLKAAETRGVSRL